MVFILVNLAEISWIALKLVPFLFQSELVNGKSEVTYRSVAFEKLPLPTTGGNVTGVWKPHKKIVQIFHLYILFICLLCLVAKKKRSNDANDNNSCGLLLRNQNIIVRQIQHENNNFDLFNLKNIYALFKRCLALYLQFSAAPRSHCENLGKQK